MSWHFLVSMFHLFHMKVYWPIRYRQIAAVAALSTFPIIKDSDSTVHESHSCDLYYSWFDYHEDNKQGHQASVSSFSLIRQIGLEQMSPLIGFHATNSDVQWGAMSIALELVLRQGFPAGTHKYTSGCPQRCCAFIAGLRQGLRRQSGRSSQHLPRETREFPAIPNSGEGPGEYQTSF